MESNWNSIVPDLLDADNYKFWSSCLEDYLLSQDLWDVIEEDEPETSESSSSSSNNNVKRIWRKKNASALHAIKKSCGPNFRSQVVEAKTAKEAWNLLASQFSTVTVSNTKIDYDRLSKIIDNNNDIYQAANNRAIYKPFIVATEKGNWSEMENFINSHREVLTATVFLRGCTALHYASYQRLEMIAMSLVDRMKAEELEIKDGNGYTPLAVAADRNNLNLLRVIVAKNKKLTSIGDENTLPVVVSAMCGYEEATNFLFQNTDINVLRNEAGVALLIHCVDNNSFDIPLKLVKRFPRVLEQRHADGTFPLLSFARKFSTLRSEVMKKKPNGLHGDGKIEGAIKFLNLVCKKVPTIDREIVTGVAGAAVIEAAKNGTVEFVAAMLSADPRLFNARDENGRCMFWHAIMNRDHEVFALIYGADELYRDYYLFVNHEDDSNILHYAAKLPPMAILDRISTSPALQLQRELQWFKEVQSLVKPHYIEDLNKDGLTPRELFDQTHKELIQLGEKLMKETAQSCTTVGALIITIMFAAAFTIPGGSDQNTGYPMFKGDALFKTFIACDALSFSSSTASIVIFLEILTSSYVKEDFVLHLPWKIMLGLLTLFISITTMTLTFCLAIVIMFEGLLPFIIPISLLASSPVALFLSSIFSLVYRIYISTFGPSIFKRNTKLPKMKEFEEISDEQEGEKILNNPLHSDHIVQLP